MNISQLSFLLRGASKLNFAFTSVWKTCIFLPKRTHEGSLRTMDRSEHPGDSTKSPHFNNEVSISNISERRSFAAIDYVRPLQSESFTESSWSDPTSKTPLPAYHSGKVIAEGVFGISHLPRTRTPAATLVYQSSTSLNEEIQTQTPSLESRWDILTYSQQQNKVRHPNHPESPLWLHPHLFIDIFREPECP